MGHKNFNVFSFILAGLRYNKHVLIYKMVVLFILIHLINVAEAIIIPTI